MGQIALFVLFLLTVTLLVIVIAWAFGEWQHRREVKRDSKLLVIDKPKENICYFDWM